MIQNPIIKEKLNEKTTGDKDMKEFLELIIENELQGKQYTKLYQSEIKKRVAANEQKKGIEK